MLSCQRERRPVVIEFRIGPAIHIVAGLTCHRETRCPMINAAALIELPKVATGARGAETNVNAGGSSGVARITCKSTVSAH